MTTRGISSAGSRGCSWGPIYRGSRWHARLPGDLGPVSQGQHRPPPLSPRCISVPVHTLPRRRAALSACAARVLWRGCVCSLERNLLASEPTGKPCLMKVRSILISLRSKERSLLTLPAPRGRPLRSHASAPSRLLDNFFPGRQDLFRVIVLHVGRPPMGFRVVTYPVR